MSSLTPFGKICRHLRLERGEKMADMASRLGVTAAYLSSIELGKRRVPVSFPRKICEVYGLDRNWYLALERVRLLSGSTITIDLDRLSDRDKETMVDIAIGLILDKQSDAEVL